MRRKIRRAVVGTFAIMSASMLMGTVAMAEGTGTSAELVSVALDAENPWSQVAVANGNYVTSGVNIRSAASQDSDILGYIYPGTAVWVLDRGETWTEFYSNGITGYVMTDYLLFGEDARQAAETYGVDGIRANWDDVNVFTAADGATVKTTLEANDSCVVISDSGNWLQIQYDGGKTGYVASEDVTRVILFESATSTDGERVPLVDTSSEVYYESGYTDTDTYYEADSSYASETWVDEPAYTEPAYTEPSYTEPAYTEPAYTEPSYTEPAYTEPTYTEPTYTEPAYTEPTYTEPTYTEPAYTEPTYTEPTYTETEPVYTEPSYVETEPQVTETEDSSTSSSNVSSDAVSLLGALIYCEAGNQSYDGMVAVGAVVMNRVNSSSFPDTISEVIYQSGQFTPASSGVLSNALANGVPSTCYEAAAAALAGENPVGSALYFNTSAGKGIQIGDHWFY